MSAPEPNADAPTAETPELTSALDQRVLRLVNPGVLAERVRVVEARVRDTGGERVRRRRCAEVIASHLLQWSQHAA